MRRVVIGVDERGETAVVGDVDLGEPHASAPFRTVWEADGPQKVPSAGAYPETVPDLFPPPGGYRVLQYSLAPGFGIGVYPAYAGPEPDRNASIAAAIHVRAGIDAPGLHCTESVDIELVLAGKVDLEIDHGKTVTLAAGDWVVQNGTRHAWRNPYPNECLLMAVFIGAHSAQATTRRDDSSAG